MRQAWYAWKAASRYLFWQAIESVCAALNVRKEAQRQLTALNPKKPQDLFDAGYVGFVYDWNNDSWRGYWRPPGSRPLLYAPSEFEVRDWSGIPWHPVKFSESLGHEVRAVEREFALKHLRIDSMWQSTVAVS